eukprot:scaffold2886_cov137-Isochrysis_galbana.AAC.4
MRRREMMRMRILSHHAVRRTQYQLYYDHHYHCWGASACCSQFRLFVHATLSLLYVSFARFLPAFQRFRCHSRRHLIQPSLRAHLAYAWDGASMECPVLRKSCQLQRAPVQGALPRMFWPSSPRL